MYASIQPQGGNDVSNGRTTAQIWQRLEEVTLWLETSKGGGNYLVVVCEAIAYVEIWGRNVRTRNFLEL